MSQMSFLKVRIAVVFDTTSLLPNPFANSLLVISLVVLASQNRLVYLTIHSYNYQVTIFLI